MKSIKRSVKAISPVLAVLMMIAVAIAGSLITYAWVTGYIGFTTEKAGKAIMIQSIANTEGGDLLVYVQNVGEGVVKLDPENCLYRNGELFPCSVDGVDLDTDGNAILNEGDTAELTLTDGAAEAGEKVTAKVTTLLGTFTEKSTYPTLGGGGGSTPTVLYRKPITFNGVIGTNDDFPVLISITDNLDIAGRSEDGHEIYFTRDDGTTKLAYEVVGTYSEDGSGADFMAWVKVPTLTSATQIYVYYGETSLPAQENPTDVWTNGYAAVWHLDETSGGTDAFKDATTYGNDGTDNGNPTPGVGGKIINAVDFDGAGDWIEAPETPSLDFNGPGLTLSAWVYQSASQTADKGVILKSTGLYEIHLGVEDSGDNGNFRVRTDGTSGNARLDITPITPGSWHYLVGTWDGTDTSAPNTYIYLDGVVGGATDFREGNIVTNNEPVVLGRRALGDPRYFDGLVDEARISNVGRSAGWIQTEFSNQNNPTSFINLGSEETV